MNPIQLVIIGIVVILILITISYYLYQEAKFKSMVENNFNQSVDDVITKADQALILDGVDESKAQISQTHILQKDMYNDDTHVDNSEHIDLQEEMKAAPLFADDEVVSIQVEKHPEDSVEAFFAEIYQIQFPFLAEVNADLDFIVDIGFEEITKVKAIPEISQFTTKPFKFYVLDKKDEWQEFAKGNKYSARALKLVVQMIDNDGIISQAQIANIYNELHKFVIQNNAHICKSDYESSITKFQKQIKHLDNIQLNLVLYIILQKNKGYSELKEFFNTLGLIDANGEFLLTDNSGRIIFTISDEGGKGLVHNQTYSLLQISTSLHKQLDANQAINSVFDCAEKFMEQFESRLLTTNKKVLAQQDYDAIFNHVKQYVTTAQKNNIELGGALIHRLF
jgi:hypothetical protein